MVAPWEKRQQSPPPQEPLPYGRWADTLAGHFRTAVRELDTEGEDIGELETEIAWFPDRTYAGRTYVPATAPTFATALRPLHTDLPSDGLF